MRRQLDALFHNGAYGQPGAVEDLSSPVLRAQFEANFFGWHELTRLAVPVMRAQWRRSHRRLFLHPWPRPLSLARRLYRFQIRHRGIVPDFEAWNCRVPASTFA